MTVSFHGCRLSLSFPFLAAAAAVLLFDRDGIAAAGFAAALLHECSHLAVMRAYCCLPEKIRVTLFGIDIVRPSRPDHSYLRDAVISVSGPAVNLAAAVLCSFFCGPAARNFVLANFALFAFNLLPIEPLDGGQALYSLLCLRFHPDAAARAVGIVSFLVLIPVAAVGFVAVFRSPGDFSLLFVCVYLMALLIFKKGRSY